jgi:hypothetical protein
MLRSASAKSAPQALTSWQQFSQVDPRIRLCCSHRAYSQRSLVEVLFEAVLHDLWPWLSFPPFGNVAVRTMGISNPEPLSSTAPSLSPTAGFCSDSIPLVLVRMICEQLFYANIKWVNVTHHHCVLPGGTNYLLYWKSVQYYCMYYNMYYCMYYV